MRISPCHGLRPFRSPEKRMAQLDAGQQDLDAKFDQYNLK